MNHVLRGVCVAVLLLLALSELYSAMSVMADYPKSASWERALCGPLFALPCVLVAGLVLLFWKRHQGIGFYASASSLMLYAAFVYADAHHTPMRRGDWIALTVWIAFCAAGIVAARFLLRQPTPRVEQADSRN